MCVVCACVCMHMLRCLEVKGQPVGIDSLLYHMCSQVVRVGCKCFSPLSHIIDSSKHSKAVVFLFLTIVYSFLQSILHKAHQIQKKCLTKCNATSRLFVSIP